MENIQLEVEIKDSPIPISINETEKILFQMKNCICKIYGNRGQIGTGFFCKIPFPNKYNLFNVLLTANHVLNENDIQENNYIYFSIGDNNEKKEYFLMDQERDIPIKN